MKKNYIKPVALFEDIEEVMMTPLSDPRVVINYPGDNGDSGNEMVPGFGLEEGDDDFGEDDF